MVEWAQCLSGHPPRPKEAERVPVVHARVQMAGLFVVVSAASLLAIYQPIILPDEPFLLYAVLALPMLASGIVVGLWYRVQRHHRTSSGAQRKDQSV